MSSYSETIIDLMRHGEPVGGRMFRGSQDDPLTDEGWRQMHNALINVAWQSKQRATQSNETMMRDKHPLPWRKVITSPLSRCAAFAQEIASGADLTLEINKGFQEISFGDWEGMTPEQIMQAFPGQLEAFWADSVKNGAPNGETVVEFHKRVSAAWDALVKTSQDQPALLVCHGGTIRMIIAILLDMPLEALWRVAVPFANITRIKLTYYEDGSTSAMLLAHQAQWHPV